MPIEGVLTCFYSDDYSEAASPAGYQQLAACRIYFQSDLPTPHLHHPKPSVMALVASA